VHQKERSGADQGLPKWNMAIIVGMPCQPARGPNCRQTAGGHRTKSSGPDSDGESTGSIPNPTFLLRIISHRELSGTNRSTRLAAGPRRPVDHIPSWASVTLIPLLFGLVPPGSSVERMGRMPPEGPPSPSPAPGNRQLQNTPETCTPRSSRTKSRCV
jgi:hypothetical protein